MLREVGNLKIAQTPKSTLKPTIQMLSPHYRVPSSGIAAALYLAHTYSLQRVGENLPGGCLELLVASFNHRNGFAWTRPTAVPAYRRPSPAFPPPSVCLGD